MSPIDYLRGVMLRDRTPATPTPAPALPREIQWANPAHTVGACIHDVIYSNCNCPPPNISAQTNTADFHADQRQ